MSRVPKASGPVLKCFLAMAFDHKDTDLLYDHIAKTLRAMDIHPIRVDRVEHNDDIDDRIFKEIAAADLMVADLTYARPSVYFEAGYAQRLVPVIYTARTDHFREHDDDPYGNRQVHFDLKMKNIIGWADPAADAFHKRLRSRVSKVIAPLLKQRNLDRAQQNRVAEFNAKSIDHKLQSLRDVWRRHFEHLKYTIIELKMLPRDQDLDQDLKIFPGAGQPFWDGMVAMKRISGDIHHFVFLDVVSTVNKNRCEVYRSRLTRMPLYSPTVGSPARIPSSAREDYIICSLTPNALRKVGEEVSYFRPGEAEKTLVNDTDIEFVAPGEARNVSRRMTFHVFDSPAQLASLADTLRERFI